MVSLQKSCFRLVKYFSARFLMPVSRNLSTGSEFKKEIGNCSLKFSEFCLLFQLAMSGICYMCNMGDASLFTHRFTHTSLLPKFSKH